MKSPLHPLSALGSGLLFGVGLVLSGMTQPRKVIGFLDVFGHWDPSLAFVMGGAVITHFALLLVIRARRQRPLLDERFRDPPPAAIDRRLILGAAIFGVGWGVSGFCPGPAIVSTGSGALASLVFVAAMALGMTLEYFASPASRVPAAQRPTIV